MRLLDEAKLPVNLTFKKVVTNWPIETELWVDFREKKRVRILTPRSENLLQSGKKVTVAISYIVFLVIVFSVP